MRIHAVVPLYPPHSLVGAWVTTHEFLRHMAGERGADVDVTAYRAHGTRQTYEGVRVTTAFAGIAPADVVVGHAGDDGSARIVADRTGARLVMMVHGGDLDGVRTKLAADRPDLAVFNSHSFRDLVDHDGPAVVIHPPVDLAAYRTRPGDRVTLVNLSPEKGADVFYALVERMPHVAFLGVVGGYGAQRLYGAPNLRVQGQTANMRGDVYAATKILLMPSQCETWGRVALEAGASGIPTLAHPTSGVVEALGSAATYRDRDDIDGWQAALDELLVDAEWRRASRAVTRRLRGWDHRAELDLFADSLETLTCRSYVS